MKGIVIFWLWCHAGREGRCHFFILLWCRVGRERQSEMTNGRRWVSSFDREIGEDICHAFLDGQVQITTTPDGTGQSDQHDPISV